MTDDPTKAVDQRFIGGAFKSDPALKALASHEAQALATRASAEARGFSEVDKALRARGLVQNMTRARGYTPFSAHKSGVRHVSVIPYTSHDPKSNLVGTIGISDGEPASGVVVELTKLQVTKIWTYDFIGGKLVEKVVPAAELIASGPSKFNDPGPRNSTPANVASHTSDRKSTRLNSSHVAISYAVFCLKKKK